MGEKKNPNCLKKDPGSAVGNKEREHRGVMGGEWHSVPSKCWLQTVCNISQCLCSQFLGTSEACCAGGGQ